MNYYGAVSGGETVTSLKTLNQFQGQHCLTTTDSLLLTFRLQVTETRANEEGIESSNVVQATRSRSHRGLLCSLLTAQVSVILSIF